MIVDNLKTDTQADLIEHCKAAVFSVLLGNNDGRGTAVAIRPNLLITCHHVVKDCADKILLVNRNSKTVYKAEVVGGDENLDLALLRSRVHLPISLQLEDGETLDDSTPLLVWSWPGWNALEQGEADPSAVDFHPAPHAAVVTDSWTENNIARFSFAGHIEGGMSGGVVVSALSGKIVGVVAASWRACSPGAAQEIAETWHLDGPPDLLSDQELQRRLEPRPAIVKAIEAQLGLGMGIALSIKEVRAFLNSNAPDVL